MAEPATSAQLLQQGLFHHRQGDLAQAMERYVEVLRIDPQNPDALYYVAVVACQEGQFPQGIELARRAIEAGPQQARVYNLLGQALYREGDRLEAIKNFDRAIALDAEIRRCARQPRQYPGRRRLPRRGSTAARALLLPRSQPSRPTTRPQNPGPPRRQSKT